MNRLFLFPFNSMSQVCVVIGDWSPKRILGSPLYIQILTPSVLIGLLSKFIITSGSIHFFVDKHNINLTHCLCCLLSLNPFLRIHLYRYNTKLSTFHPISSLINLSINLFISVYSSFSALFL